MGSPAGCKKIISSWFPLFSGNRAFPCLPIWVFPLIASPPPPQGTQRFPRDNGHSPLAGNFPLRDSSQAATILPQALSGQSGVPGPKDKPRGRTRVGRSLTNRRPKKIPELSITPGEPVKCEHAGLRLWCRIARSRLLRRYRDVSDSEEGLG